LDYTGQRQHSDADFRNLNSRWHFPLANGWSLAATADFGWDPRADNPGALTAAEMTRNPDSAAAINITRVAGKDVTQGQGGVTVRRQFEGGGEAALTVYGNVGTSFETPTTTELTNRPSGAGGFNPTLEPQKATNYEVGVRGDLGRRLNYSLAVYHAAVRGELISFPVPADTNGRVFFQNAGTSRHRGVELGTELEIASGLNLTT